MLRIAFAIFIGLLAPLAHAQVCPDKGTPLSQVRNIIDDFIRNGRAPAGADCAFSWASGLNLGSPRLSDEVLLFFRTASDVQRQAAKLRLSSGNKALADPYLKREIELRQALTQAATSYNEPAEVARLRTTVVQNISYTAAAMGLRDQYEAVTEMLGNQDPTYVDKEALRVWLQALWSCSNWDGQTANICAQPKKDLCRDKISVFLDAWNTMGPRELPPQTRHDINGLRKLTDKGGCLG